MCAALANVLQNYLHNLPSLLWCKLIKHDNIPDFTLKSAKIVKSWTCLGARYKLSAVMLIAYQFLCL